MKAKVKRTCVMLYWLDSFLRFNYQPIIPFLYYATWNKGVRLQSVLELWLIVETLVMSENEGTTVIQTRHTTVVCATRDKLIFSVAEHDERWRVINTSNNINNSNGLNSILHFAVCYRRMCVCTPRLCLCVCLCLCVDACNSAIH